MALEVGGVVLNHGIYKVGTLFLPLHLSIYVFIYLLATTPLEASRGTFIFFIYTSVESNILNLDLDQLEESLDPTTLFSDKTGLATIGLKAITLKVNISR